MSSLTKNDVLKIRILKQLKLKNIDYTASYLANLLKSKFETTKKALEFFYQIDILDKDVKEHNTKKITYYRLNENGLNIIKTKKL